MLAWLGMPSKTFKLQPFQTHFFPPAIAQKEKSPMQI